MATRISIFTLKLLLAGALIYWLYRLELLDFTPLYELQATLTNLAYLLIAFFCFSTSLLIMSWRLWLLLRLRHFAASFSDVMNITCVSSFAGALLPGLVGADAIKILFLCSRVKERRADAFIAVVFDRVIGLYSLFVVASLAACGVWLAGIPGIPGYLLWSAPLMTVVATAGMMLLHWRGFFHWPPMRAVYTRLPMTLQNMVRAFRDLAMPSSTLGLVLGLSLLNHIIGVSAFLCAVYLLGEILPVVVHFTFTPLALLMNAVPLTPGGLGITESAFAFLFQLAGSEQGALVGLIGRLLQYLAFFVFGSISLFFLKWRGYPIEVLTPESGPES